MKLENVIRKTQKQQKGNQKLKEKIKKEKKINL